jgi:hypothetical protein
MIKKLLLTTALLAPGLAHSGTITDPLQPLPPVVPSGGSIACAIGPNYTGSIPADAQTAGFTTCALNSDFSTPSFADITTWLAGPNCYNPPHPVWWNSDPGPGIVNPCSDYSIVTDGSNGQVLDMRFTNADNSSGAGYTQMVSLNPYTPIPHPGQTYGSGGMYTEWRGRVSSQTVHAFDGGTQHLAGGPFKYAQPGYGSHPFEEVDLDEMYFNPIGIAGGANAANLGTNYTNGVYYMPFPNSMHICPTGCTNFDPTIMHTFGLLETTNGGDTVAFCTYLDGQKLGCATFLMINPNNNGYTTADIWNAADFWIWQVGGGLSIPTPFNGPLDTYIQYFRVFACSTWNSATPGCPGPLVTQ